MAVNISSDTEMPVIRNLRDFDQASGNALERAVFNHRVLVLLMFLITSVFLGYHATQLRANGSFEDMLPSSHPYMRNFLEHREDLSNLGNRVAIAVENTSGDIYDPEYLEVLRKVTDTIMVTKGVSRGWAKSLWLPTVRWTDIVEEGYAGGPVMPDDFDGSPALMTQLKRNVERAHLTGNLVAADLKSSMVVVPLLSMDPDTGQPLDYHELSNTLEEKVRALETGNVKIHIVGFAKLVGDLIDGLRQVMSFFAIAAVLAGIIVFVYTRCLRTTLLLVAVAALGVLWMLGLVELLGFTMDPYSILVPFLVFAIGLSHGAQKMNGIMIDIAHGTHAYVAARYTFRRLFMAGLTALLANVVGFAVLAVVDIPVIRNLALTTSIGVAVLIFTKLLLIPVALSYLGVSASAAERRLRLETEPRPLRWYDLEQFIRFTDKKWAYAAVVTAAVVAGVGYCISRDLQVGDLGAGAPELWPDSRYNRDLAFITKNYGMASDQLAVIVKTEKDGALQPENLLDMERLGWRLQQVRGVQAVMSLAELVPRINMAQFEASPKWMTIPRNQNAGAAVHTVWSSTGAGLVNVDYSVMPVIAYLSDHRAQTLERVLAEVEDFAREYDSDHIRFLPVAGNAGIEAVTNIVVRQAHAQMLGLLYAAVVLLCFITLCSWRAVLVALIPLIITAIICEALMVKLDIGLKVATLPVHALGVGVGVDYALYLLSIQLGLQRQGASLREAYAGAIRFTGRVVALVGITMAVGVVTWIWSPIKFQADMGLLLTFMFLWNMLGALLLIPALSCFLLRGEGVGARRAADATTGKPVASGRDS